VGLLLGAPRAGDIDRLLDSEPASGAAAARRSAAKASSVTFRAAIEG